MPTKKATEPQTRRRTGMRAEYRFDYAAARPNRFAERASEGTVAVVLDPDVARVFRTSDSVNALLRSVIAAMPVKVRPCRTRP